MEPLGLAGGPTCALRGVHQHPWLPPCLATCRTLPTLSPQLKFLRKFPNVPWGAKPLFLKACVGAPVPGEKTSPARRLQPHGSRSACGTGLDRTAFHGRPVAPRVCGRDRPAAGPGPQAQGFSVPQPPGAAETTWAWAPRAGSQLSAHGRGRPASRRPADDCAGSPAVGGSRWAPAVAEG